MKLTLIAIIVSVVSFSSFAAMTVSDSNKALGKAEFNHQRDNNNLDATQEQREDSRDALAQALSDKRDAVTANQQMKAGIASKKNPGNVMAPGTLAPTATYSENPQTTTYSGVSTRPATGLPTGPVVNGTSYRLGITQQQVKQAGTLTGLVTDTAIDRPDVGAINVSVSSLKPSTPVNVTVNGVTTETTAGVISQLDPTVQVEVPHVDALIHTEKGNAEHNSKGGKAAHGGSGRGGDNAQSHAMGGHGYGADNSHSEGFGGHSHFH